MYLKSLRYSLCLKKSESSHRFKSSIASEPYELRTSDWLIEISLAKLSESWVVSDILA